MAKPSSEQVATKEEKESYIKDFVGELSKAGFTKDASPRINIPPPPKSPPPGIPERNSFPHVTTFVDSLERAGITDYFSDADDTIWHHLARPGSDLVKKYFDGQYGTYWQTNGQFKLKDDANLEDLKRELFFNFEEFRFLLESLDKKGINFHILSQNIPEMMEGLLEKLKIRGLIGDVIGCNTKEMSKNSSSDFFTQNGERINKVKHIENKLNKTRPDAKEVRVFYADDDGMEYNKAPDWFSARVCKSTGGEGRFRGFLSKANGAYDVGFYGPEKLGYATQAVNKFATTLQESKIQEEELPPLPSSQGAGVATQQQADPSLSAATVQSSAAQSPHGEQKATSSDIQGSSTATVLEADKEYDDMPDPEPMDNTQDSNDSLNSLTKSRVQPSSSPPKKVTFDDGLNVTHEYQAEDPQEDVPRQDANSFNGDLEKQVDLQEWVEVNFEDLPDSRAASAVNATRDPAQSTNPSDATASKQVQVEASTNQDPQVFKPVLLPGNEDASNGTSTDDQDRRPEVQDGPQGQVDKGSSDSPVINADSDDNVKSDSVQSKPSRGFLSRLFKGKSGKKGKQLSIDDKSSKPSSPLPSDKKKGETHKGSATQDPNIQQASVGSNSKTSGAASRSSDRGMKVTDDDIKKVKQKLNKPKREKNNGAKVTASSSTQTSDLGTKSSNSNADPKVKPPRPPLPSSVVPATDPDASSPATDPNADPTEQDIKAFRAALENPGSGYKKVTHKVQILRDQPESERGYHEAFLDTKEDTFDRYYREVGDKVYFIELISTFVTLSEAKIIRDESGNFQDIDPERLSFNLGSGRIQSLAATVAQGKDPEFIAPQGLEAQSPSSSPSSVRGVNKLSEGNQLVYLDI